METRISRASFLCTFAVLVVSRTLLTMLYIFVFNSRWAEDMILYSTKEFGFVSLSDAYRLAFSGHFS